MSQGVSIRKNISGLILLHLEIAEVLAYIKGVTFFAFFERAKESGKRARSVRHERRGNATSRVSSAPRSLPAFLSSLGKREKISPVMQATEV